MRLEFTASRVTVELSSLLESVKEKGMLMSGNGAGPLGSKPLDMPGTTSLPELQLAADNSLLCKNNPAVMRK